MNRCYRVVISEKKEIDQVSPQIPLAFNLTHFSERSARIENPNSSKTAC